MDVNLERNRAYYSQLSSNALCDCAYCRNYYSQAKAAYPEVASYLQRLEVDMEKPFETSPLEPENGYLTYCACQYIIFGSCEAGYHDKIGDVELRKADFYPDTGILEPHFVLELFPITLRAIF